MLIDELVSLLSQKQRLDLAQNIYLRDMQMRDDDRRCVQKDIYNSYNSLVKILLTLASLTFGGSALLNLHDICLNWLLYIGWFFLAASIIIIVIELDVSIRLAHDYAKKLAVNDGGKVDSPETETILKLIRYASIAMVIGLCCVISSIALGEKSHLPGTYGMRVGKGEQIIYVNNGEREYMWIERKVENNQN